MIIERLRTAKPAIALLVKLADHHGRSLELMVTSIS